MKRSLRTVVALFLLVAACSLVASLPACLKYAAQEALLNARRRGATVAWSDLTASMTQVQLRSLSLWLPGPIIGSNQRVRVPIPLELTNLSAWLRPASILTLSPQFSLAAGAYNGALNADVRPGLKSHSINVRLKDVQLNRHPALAAFGLKAGLLSASLDGGTFTQDQLTGGAFTLSLANVDPPALDDHLKIVKLDPIGPLDLGVRGEITASTVDIESLSLSGPLLSVAGSGSVHNPNTPTPAISANIRIDISSRGSQVLGPWLPLLTNGRATADTRQLNCSISTRRCGAGGIELPLGPLCLAVTC